MYWQKKYAFSSKSVGKSSIIIIITTLSSNGKCVAGDYSTLDGMTFALKKESSRNS